MADRTSRFVDMAHSRRSPARVTAEDGHSPAAPGPTGAR